jgi:DNA ligase 1
MNKPALHTRRAANPASAIFVAADTLAANAANIASAVQRPNCDPARRRLLSGLGLGLGLSLGCQPLFAKPSHAQALPIPLAMHAPEGVEPQGFLVSEKFDGVRAVWDGHSLRFRSGQTIHAPTWFLRRLPAQPLDGELWLGRGRFEALSGAVRRQQPSDEEWRALRYCVFELPKGQGGFAARATQLSDLLRAHGWAQLMAVQQQTLKSPAALRRLLDEVVAGGGEGLILRAADASYNAGRSAGMLKLKPLQDAEAVVVAHEAGSGRLNGRMGALRVRTDQGIEFKIGTGFSDEQRLRPPALGARISFNYRGLTDDGVPRFASFMRLRPDGI